MKPEEKVVFDHLLRLYGKNVVFEPDGNIPPDFVVNTSIAVEVRRLNQSFFSAEKAEGLEKLTFNLSDAFKSVLKSLNHLYRGKSYYVSIYYKRPLSCDMRQANKDMKQALINFLNSDISKFPYIILVNPTITFSIDFFEPGDGILFEDAGSSDLDEDGWLISNYAENILHCITEKSSKISKRQLKYNEWWLYLVDYMRWGLGSKDVRELLKLIGNNTENFEKVLILSENGENLLATISKQHGI